MHGGIGHLPIEGQMEETKLPSSFALILFSLNFVRRAYSIPEAELAQLGAIGGRQSDDAGVVTIGRARPTALQQAECPMMLIALPTGAPLT
ncbi:MAG: hypothetical protein R3E79_37895 [Caldilineaceae bacterium]